MASTDTFDDCETEEEVHNTLMTSFCCDFLPPTLKETFEKFKMKSFLHLKSPAEQSSIANTHDIWEALSRKGVLSSNNYKELKKLVKGIDVKLIMLIEDAENKLLVLKEGGTTVRKRQRTLNDRIDEKKLQEKLFQIYHNEIMSQLRKTSRLALDKNFVPVSIRTDLECREKRRRVMMPTERKPLNCADDMFFIDGNMVRNIFIFGEAGIGKSEFCQRLIDNWCKAKKSDETEANSSRADDRLRSWVHPFRIFDFLFCIQLRHFQNSSFSIIDMIIKDEFRNYPSSHFDIRQVISREKYRCVIVIDGLDEWNASDKLIHESLSNTEKMPNCTFIWSMRPWMMEKCIEMIRGNYRVVEIQGLDCKDVNIVIEKLLINFYELDEKSMQFKEKAKEIKRKSLDTKLKSIIQIPLMAIACIQIWYEEKEVGNSLTSLYVALLDFFIGQHMKSSTTADTKETLAIHTLKSMPVSRIFQHNTNIKEIWPFIIRMGRLAYDSLVSRKTCLVFQKQDLEQFLENYELDKALEIGLLSKCVAPGSCNVKKFIVNFFHKSIQEFLAAIYIENNVDICEFNKHLSNVEVILELGNVLIFLSGINPMLGSSISKHVVDVVDNDSVVCQTRCSLDFMRDDKIGLLYDLQAKCFRELEYSKKYKYNEIEGMSYHISDVKIHADSDLETIRTTVDILKYHHCGIRSLWISSMPQFAYNETDISETLLTEFLNNSKSLESFFLNGNNANLVFSTISETFSLLTAIGLYNILLTPDAIRTLKVALQSNKVIKSLGLVNIRCQLHKDHVPTPASLSDIILILPDMPCLTALSISIYNQYDKPVFRHVLCRLFHLNYFKYCGALPVRDDEYDRDVIQTVCTWSGLRRLFLFFVDLGDRGLYLSSGMLHITNVLLCGVTMPSSGWRYFIQSVLNIKHLIHVLLYNVNIDEEIKILFRTCQDIKIDIDQTDDDGRNHYCFRKEVKTN